MFMVAPAVRVLMAIFALVVAVMIVVMLTVMTATMMIITIMLHQADEQFTGVAGQRAQFLPAKPVDACLLGVVDESSQVPSAVIGQAIRQLPGSCQNAGQL